MKNTAILISIIVLLNSCTKGLREEIVPVELNVNNIGTITVIDAKIEKDSSAWVQISYSNDINNPYTAEPIYEINATVQISANNGIQETLAYTGSKGTYKGSSIKGSIGTNYNLTIIINDQTYTANATMLPTASYNKFEINEITGSGKNGILYLAYDEVWYVNNDPNARNFYMFEWWTNGVHNKEKDWAIDDDRIPNGSNGIRVFNPSISPNANERLELKTAEVDLSTYNYFNMYEKIVRGMVGVSGQTPYNPVSNFGAGTVGNFRAISFTNYVALIPPALYSSSEATTMDLRFARNDFFIKYNLFWSTSPGVTLNSNVLNLPFTEFVDKDATYGLIQHTGLSSGTTYYYRIQAEDIQGNQSMLSQEISNTTQ
jgi:hypothetical protein